MAAVAAAGALDEDGAQIQNKKNGKQTNICFFIKENKSLFVFRFLILYLRAVFV